MRVRQFRVPFTRVVGDDATELEFGEDDFMVVRPIFGLSASQVADLSKRMTALSEEDDEAAADALLLELMDAAIVEWNLTGPDGQAIPRPKTGDEVRALPAGLAGAFFAFIATYRGDAANPTTRA